ncbi:MAG TPA: DUF4169 family protein [Novosphingobium sp.]|nr:DUF4169 family protein [Novosphingobium sp.]HMP55419.1 DUF4169 family protein [Novosphingobium sp.]
MAEVINLRMARKARRRAAAEATAAEARAKSGETKTLREKRGLDAERAARRIEGARRDRTP